MSGLKIKERKIVFPSLKKDMSLIVPKAKAASLPRKAAVPLIQPNGEEAIALVKEGDFVKTGSQIGKALRAGGVSVHASLSGMVSKVGICPHPVLGRALAVLIESDGMDERAYGLRKEDP